MKAWHKNTLYSLTLLLCVTGFAWLILYAQSSDASVDAMAQQAQKLWLMRAHALGASLMLMLLGAVLVAHSQPQWRTRRKRASGTLHGSAWLVLALTAYSLGYAPEGLLREASQWLHWGVGLAMPLLVWWHVRGKKSEIEEL
jgi:hypothetical protein